MSQFGSPQPRVAERSCPLCGSRVPELLSPSGRRHRGRPRVFCSERCRLGDRRLRVAVDPRRRREQVAAFAAAVRDGIGASGLSLRDLESTLVADYPSLASSVATLSAWQTGTSSPPRTQIGQDRVLALERCLGLPAGDLALLVPGGGAIVPPRPPARTVGLAARQARLAHLLTTLAGPQQVLPVSMTKDVHVGAGRRPGWVRITQQVRAAHDGVDRFWYVEGTDPRLDPVVVRTSGCRAGRRVTEPSPPPGPPLVAAELLLERRLARGERYEFSFEVRYGVGMLPAGPLVRHTLDQPAESLDLSLSFEGGPLPAEVLACRWRQRDGAETAARAVTRPGCRAYQLVVADPGPGGYGWRWVPADAVRRTRRSAA